MKIMTALWTIFGNTLNRFNIEPEIGTTSSEILGHQDPDLRPEMRLYMSIYTPSSLRREYYDVRYR